MKAPPALPRVAAACGLAAALLAVLLPVVAASGQPGYSHASQFISELGAAGAPHASLVGWAGFLPIGVLAMLFALLAARCVPAGRARAGLHGFACVGAAYVASAFFPCDAGCPADGSTAQRIHNLFGAGEYLGGGLALAALATADGALPRALRALAGVASALVVLAFAGMLWPGLAPVRGWLQRVAEIGLFGWMMAASAHLQADARERA